MPVQRCRLNNKPGYKWPSKDCPCYTYDPLNKSAETRAWNKANDFGISTGEVYADIVDRLQKIRKFTEAPPFHDSCQCELVDGKVVTEDGACDYCIERAQEYNND